MLREEGLGAILEEGVHATCHAQFVVAEDTYRPVIVWGGGQISEVKTTSRTAPAELWPWSPTGVANYRFNV